MPFSAVPRAGVLGRHRAEAWPSSATVYQPQVPWDRLAAVSFSAQSNFSCWWTIHLPVGTCTNSQGNDATVSEASPGWFLLWLGQGHAVGDLAQMRCQEGTQGGMEKMESKELVGNPAGSALQKTLTSDGSLGASSSPEMLCSVL